jgi:hypothetical protein
MQIKLKREENISIKSWINDKPITDPNWEVYSSSDSDTCMTIVAMNKTTNTQLKLEITKNIPYEDDKETNE